MTEEQENELFERIKRIETSSAKHLEIAERYWSEVGKPWHELKRSLALFWKVAVWIITGVLTYLGLSEMWEGYISKHFKR